ncbi:MAG: exosortase-associated EpsI family protein [Phycisphaeraceae bacterium]|nr:exosortase-associated EpsI family protein [Phycisphaeraceae bacterium]
MLTRGRQTWISMTAATALLTGIAVQKAWTTSSPGDAESYHQQVAQAAGEVPYRIGTWVGQDAPVPPAAITLLKPNVLISRRYFDLRTGLSAGVLLVQCRDARDMGGHYPPVCYPGQGWSLRTSTAVDWNVRGEVIHGKEYEFLKQGPSQADQLIVDNFMVVPHGPIARDMTSIRQIASHYSRRHFGAAQMQVVFMGRVDPDWRRRAGDELVDGFLPLILTIQQSRGEL